MNFILEMCPICHFSFPASALPTHIAGHAAHVRALELEMRSNRELADMLKVEVWAELDPLRDADKVAIVEAVVARLEAMP